MYPWKENTACWTQKSSATNAGNAPGAIWIPRKLHCDNCMKCIQTGADYNAVEIDEIIDDDTQEQP